MFKKAGIAFVVVSLVLGIVVMSGASAHPWGPSPYGYHWNRYGSSVTIGIYNTSTGRYYTTSQAAKNDWDSNTILYLPNRSSHTDISVFNANSGATGWAGLASIESWENLALNHIGHVHSQVNTYYANSYSDSYVQGIYCQEIGHGFGLDHSNTGDCMGLGYYSSTTYYTGPHNWNDIYNVYRYSHHSAAPAVQGTNASDKPTAFAVWAYNPKSLGELKSLAKDIVMGKVVKVEKGRDIVHNIKGEPKPVRIPTQTITFEVTKSFKGVPAGTRVQIFKTGDGNFRIADDPAYEVGKEYLLFLKPQGGTGKSLVVSPAGRYQVEGGKLRSVTEEGLGARFDGFSVQSFVQRVQSAR